MVQGKRFCPISRFVESLTKACEYNEKLRDRSNEDIQKSMINDLKANFEEYR